MNTPAPTKCTCTTCGGHLEFEAEHSGCIIPCPHCGTNTTLYIPFQPALPPPIPLPPPRIAQDQPEWPQAFIISKNEVAGAGCLLQFVGIILLFFFPVGTFIGIGLIIFGSIAARKPICSRCGSSLNSRRITFCPACSAVLN